MLDDENTSGLPETETVDEGNGEQQEQPEQSDEGEKSKPGRGFTKKLAKKDAEIAALRQQLEQFNSKDTLSESGRKTEDRPRYEDFATNEEYFEAVADWKVEQRFKKEGETAREREIRQQQQKVQDTYLERAVEFSKNTPDFDDALEDMETPLTVNMVQAIQESDVGPEIAYYLAKNPDEAEKASKMSVFAFNRYIGRLETKFEKQDTQDVQVKATKAPAPIAPIRKSSVTSSKDPGDMSLSEFEAWERSRKK